MNPIYFETLLGESYKEFSKAVDGKLSVQPYKEGFLIHIICDQYSLFGVDAPGFSLIADAKKKIRSIKIPLNEIIDQHFYKAFTEVYGKPTKIFVATHAQDISSGISEDKNFRQHLTKRTFEMVEGTFDDTPAWMLWKKPGFTISILLKHKDPLSEITFEKVNA